MTGRLLLIDLGVRQVRLVRGLLWIDLRARQGRM